MKKFRTIIIAGAVALSLVILWLTSPEFFEGVIAVNEKKARRILCEIAAAQEEYHKRHGIYGSLPDLRAKGLTDIRFEHYEAAHSDYFGAAHWGWSEISSQTVGMAHGYWFDIMSNPDRWEITAEPGTHRITGIHCYSISSKNGGIIESEEARAVKPLRSNWLSRLLGN